MRQPICPTVLGFLCISIFGCDAPGQGPDITPMQNICGPSRAKVVSVIDGDTIVLDSGERVRYLMIDTPEITQGKDECFGQEARELNSNLVLGQEVELTYDTECTDRYGRLLAYVESPDGEANTILVERGMACVLMVPPNGRDREDEFRSLEFEASQTKEGMWGACPSVSCAN